MSNLERRLFLRMASSVVVGASIAGCTEEPESTSTPSDDQSTSTDQSTSAQTESENSPDEPAEDPTDSEDDPELGHLHGITGQTYPPDIDGHYNRRYEWNSGGGEWWLELNISKALEEYYAARHRQRNRGTFVSDPYDDDLIGFIASEFERFGDEYGLSEREIVDLAMEFVQQLRYTPDEVATGFSQHTYYPVETLVDRGGDCEDTAILLAAILRDMGYDCVLLALWDAEHMALGVKGDSSIPGTYYEYNGNRYYYVETTGYGWGIGEMPPQVENTQAEIQEIYRYPTLIYGWETSTGSAGDVTVNAFVRNVGSEIAQNTSFYAEFENQSEHIHSRAETQIGSLEYDESTTVGVVMEPPDDETLRVNTALYVDNDIHDLDLSEWRRPVSVPHKASSANLT